MEIKVGMELELNKYGRIKIIKRDKNDCFFIRNDVGFEGWLHYGEILDYLKEDKK